MKKTILIATTSVPNKTDWEAWKQQITDCGAKYGVTVGEQMMTDGPGCANYALEVEGTEKAIEDFGNMLTMAMMPARWSFTSDPVTPGYFLTK